MTHYHYIKHLSESEYIEWHLSDDDCSAQACRVDNRHDVVTVISRLHWHGRYTEQYRAHVERELTQAIIDTRPPATMPRACKLLLAIEWIETHVLRHRPYALCQWIGKAVHDRGCGRWGGSTQYVD